MKRLNNHNLIKRRTIFFLSFLIVVGIISLTFILVVRNSKKNNFSNQSANSIEQERQKYQQKLEQLPNWNLVSETEKENLKKEINNSQSGQLNNILEQAKKLIKKKQGNPGPNPKPKLPNQTPLQQPPTNNPYSALIPTNQEKEYKHNPHLLISSVGTDYSKLSKTNNNNLLPGSALLTDTLDGSGGGFSTLNNKGITYIIHAAPWPRDLFKSDEDFIDCVVKSVQNSIILADRSNFEKLAIPLIGGGIYLASCDPEKLAEGLIRGAINQLENCQNLKEITFIDSKGNQIKHFEKAFLERFAKELKEKWVGKISVIAGGGDIRDKNLHGASVIVNAANTQVQFGGGISGAIAEQVGDKNKINQKAKELINKFNSSPTKKNRDKNEEILEIEVYNEVYNIPSHLAHDFKNTYYGKYTIFRRVNISSNSDEENYFLINKNHLNHPAHGNLYHGKYNPYKLTIYKKDEKKLIFEVDDFVEIERQKK